MLNVGIDIGGTKIAGGIVDPDGTIVDRRRVPTPADPHALADAVAAMVDDLVTDRVVHAVGVAAAGFIDASRSVILHAPNIDWTDEPLRDELRTRLGERNGRLGVDAVIGDGVTALAGARVTIGPVSLDQYLLHTTDTLQRLRRILYGLVLPAQLVRPTEERWQVTPPARGAVVGVASEPVRLGINSRLQSPSSGPTA